MKTKVYAVTFSPDGRTLATDSADTTARLWDAATGQPRGEPLKHEDWVFAVRFSPTGRTLATPAGTRRRGCGTPPPASHGGDR